MSLADDERFVCEARALTEDDPVRYWREKAEEQQRLIERLEQVDAAILDMAEAVGELGAPSAGLDLSKICRYRKGAGADVGHPSA